MRSCFRSLERRGVRYLLISGQASVLYGAAEFSEDVDLWVEPGAANVGALSKALHDCGARVYKLTPPLLPAHLRRGHGFHFIVPDDDGGPRYLDIMGRPPRVGAFSSSLRRSQAMSSVWGTVPVVDIPDLVELKKTRRLGDYDVISNLVRGRLQARGTRPTARVLAWALTNCFRASDAAWILESWPHARDIAGRSARSGLQALLHGWSPGSPLDVECEARAQAAMTTEIALLQRKDFTYWSPIIGELREMRRAGVLLPEGQAF